MKKLICWIAFLCGATISCDRKEYNITTKFEIINQSGKDIVIYTHDIPESTITINDSETFSDQIITSSRYGTENFSDLFDSDSVKIVYENQKYKIYKCLLYKNGEGCNEDRNILSFLDYEESGDNVYLLRYTFTEEDYLNAEFCNEECD